MKHRGRMGIEMFPIEKEYQKKKTKIGDAPE